MYSKVSRPFAKILKANLRIRGKSIWKIVDFYNEEVFILEGSVQRGVLLLHGITYKEVQGVC